ncbi:hypothetical protein [Endozoicomonas lisbonensis]|uniref:hypothetical protein n=1 Tax=Endozoicomonas lisbonensis TaxID=3120522 RepID=UPI0033989A7B
MTPPPVTTDKTPLSPLTRKTKDRNQRRNTTTTTTEKDVPAVETDFAEFAWALCETMKEMLDDEGGWLPKGVVRPKTSWVKRKAATLFNKFPNPCPEDCAVLLIGDWSRLVAPKKSSSRSLKAAA